MAIVYDFKNIKKACNDISESILGPDKGDKVVVFEPEVEFDESCTKSTPRFPPVGQASPTSPIPPVPKGPGIIKKGLHKYCEACRCRLIQKPGYGWYCTDCDEFREV